MLVRRDWVHSGWYGHRQVNVVLCKRARGCEGECCRQGGGSIIVQAVVIQHELGNSNSKVFVCLFYPIALAVRMTGSWSGCGKGLFS